MSVTDDQSIRTYEPASDTTGPFTFDNTVYENADETTPILVTKTDSAGVASVLVEDTDYAVSIASDDSSADITTTDPIQGTLSETITLSRNQPYEQQDTYTTGTTFPAKTVERQLDKQTIMAQQNRDDRVRTLRAPITDDPLDELPSADDRAEKYLYFDVDGQPVASDGTSGLADASVTTAKLADDAVTAAKIAAITATGSTEARNIEDRLADVVNVKDFGAVGDGVTDDTDALAAALTASPAGAMLNLDNSTFMFTALTVSKDITFIGNGKLIGTGTTGSAPTRATLVAAGSAGARETLITGHYDSTISLSSNVVIYGDVEIEQAIVSSSTGNAITSQGRLSLTNVGFLRTEVKAALEGSIEASGFVSTDSPGTGIHALRGGKVSASDAIITYPSSRGLYVLHSGVINAPNAEIYYSGSAGAYALFGGTIIVTNGDIQFSTLSGVLTNYGGSIDCGSATISNNTQSGIACESNGAVYAQSATVDSNGQSGIFVVYGGVVQAGSASITNSGQYGAYANGAGVIYLDSATVDSTNTGVGGQILRAIGTGYIFAEEPGTGGFATLTSANYFPGYNRVGAGAAYVGEHTADNAQVTVGAYRHNPSNPSVTIATGSITATSTKQRVDTEAYAATDDLDTIVLTSEVDMMYVSAASTTRTIVIKNATGNIVCNGGADITLDDDEKIALLVKSETTWRAILIA